MDKIEEALKRLDVANDNHWTADGLPKLETVRLMASNQKISRDDITKLAPKFTRTTPALASEPVDATGETTGLTPTPGDLKTSIGPQMSETEANAVAVANQTLGSEQPNPDAIPKKPLTDEEKASLASEASTQAIVKEGAQLTPVLGTGANRDPVKNLTVDDESERGNQPNMALKVPNPVPHDANSNPTNPDTKLARMEMPNADGVYNSNQEPPNVELEAERAALAEADALQDQIEEVQVKLDELHAERAEFDRRLRQVEMEHDELVTKQTKLRLKTRSDTYTRMEYLEAQRKIREAAVAAAGGADALAARPQRAPIDKAMERKSNSRVGVRPKTLG